MGSSPEICQFLVGNLCKWRTKSTKKNFWTSFFALCFVLVLQSATGSCTYASGRKGPKAGWHAIFDHFLLILRNICCHRGLMLGGGGGGGRGGVTTTEQFSLKCLGITPGKDLYSIHRHRLLFQVNVSTCMSDLVFLMISGTEWQANDIDRWDYHIYLKGGQAACNELLCTRRSSAWVQNPTLSRPIDRVHISLHGSSGSSNKNSFRSLS